MTDDELTEEALDRATRTYYDRRPVVGDAWDREPVGELADVTEETARLEAALRGVVEGRSALELGCGAGALTRVAAGAARSIVALDTSATCLRLARAACPQPHVRFEEGDAYQLASSLGIFDAAYAGGLYHLVPKRRRQAFLDGLHARLAPGARVFIAATRTRTLRARRRQVAHPAGGDLLSRRELADGSSYLIVNNEPDEPELRAIFPRRDLAVAVGDAYWWVTYTV